MADFIPVDKKMPEEEKLVIIQRRGGTVSAGYMLDDEWFDLNEGMCGSEVDDVIFWQPFPAARQS